MIVMSHIERSPTDTSYHVVLLINIHFNIEKVNIDTPLVRFIIFLDCIPRYKYLIDWQAGWNMPPVT